MSISDINKIVHSAPDGFDPKTYVPRFKQKYHDVVSKYMMETYKYTNKHMIPSFDKITISSSISNLNDSKDNIFKIYNSLYLMTGVLPVYSRSSRSISQFRLHAGSITGCKVVLRHDKMYEFMERLILMYLVNIKGFRGIPFKSINRTTLSIGIKDANIVKEIAGYIKMMYFGFTITIDVNCPSKSSDEVYDFLKQFDFPLRKDI